jgi:hypothetical protein
MEQAMRTINVAKDFSSAPSGRHPEDGPFNGERFRVELLVPSLEDPEGVEIQLDGVSGFGSSFLEEAFGGLVRIHHFSSDDLRKRIHIQYSDPDLIYYAESIIDFISDAVPE